MRIDLPDNYNTKQVKEAILAEYPDLEFKIKPKENYIVGSGNDVKTTEAYITIEQFKDYDKSEVELRLKQSLFDLVPEKTDEEEKQEKRLERALLSPEFVYILRELDDLKKEIKKLKKETQKKGEAKNESIPESPQEPREKPEFIPSER